MVEVKKHWLFYPLTRIAMALRIRWIVALVAPRALTVRKK